MINKRSFHKLSWFCKDINKGKMKIGKKNFHPYSIWPYKQENIVQKYTCLYDFFLFNVLSKLVALLQIKQFTHDWKVLFRVNNVSNTAFYIYRWNSKILEKNVYLFFPFSIEMHLHSQAQKEKHIHKFLQLSFLCWTFVWLKEKFAFS